MMNQGYVKTSLCCFLLQLLTNCLIFCCYSVVLMRCLDLMCEKHEQLDAQNISEPGVNQQKLDQLFN